VWEWLVRVEKMVLSCWFKIGLIIRESIRVKLRVLRRWGVGEGVGEGIGDRGKEESKKKVNLRRAIVSARENLSKVILE